jgi:pimeloyl-ACP methyl ester carboxylesterase
VVEGACDKLLRLGWAKQVADQIRESHSAVVDAAGHCPQIEQPAVVNKLLVEFLGARP